MTGNQNLSELKKNFQNLSQQTSVNELVQCFLENQKPPYLYFKWLPEFCALKLIYSKPFKTPSAIRLYESEFDFKMDDLNDPMKIKSLAQVVQTVSAGKKMFSYLVSFKKQPFGLMFLNEKNIFIENLFCAFQMKCEALAWKKQCAQLSNRKYLLKTLFAEISRARHLQSPVSLIIIRCHSYNEIEKNNGRQNLLLFFKSIYNHISKNSRSYDSIIQISPEQMALVLPHTSEKAAAEKAEKIHWILNSLNYKDIFSMDAPVVFQIGVAEYPKVARDAVDLLKIAQLSCSYKNQENKGGVCLATAINNFKPDFPVSHSFA